MAMIKKTSVNLVRDRVDIEKVISPIVTLKKASGSSLKGLCPFHDEKTPSFNVNLNNNYYHCFGCGEHGDAISFVMKIQGLDFKDAVESLASQFGVSLEYEAINKDFKQTKSVFGEISPAVGIKNINDETLKFFQSNMANPEAKPAWEMILGRKFTNVNARDFELGYSLKNYDALSRHLQNKGFTSEMIIEAGLASRNKNGGIGDFFQGRLMFPIRDASSRLIGFGGRKLYEDSLNSGKFVNSKATALYNKSKVLYGIDRARKTISKNHRAIIVEGYMDVMSFHLNDYLEAVAPCGTSFTIEQLMIINRLLGIDNVAKEIVFVFDGDEAGVNAAKKAFLIAKDYLSICFVCVPPDKKDPCDIRMEEGKTGLDNLINSKIPITEFVLEQTVSGFNLSTIEGKNLAIKQGLAILNTITDKFLHDEYVNYLNRRLKIDDISTYDNGPGPQFDNVELSADATGTNLDTFVSEISKYVKLDNKKDLLELNITVCILNNPKLISKIELNKIHNISLNNTLRIIKDNVERIPATKSGGIILDLMPDGAKPFVSELQFYELKYNKNFTMVEFLDENLKELESLVNKEKFVKEKKQQLQG
jgi:DNA primase